jgi:serine O-acetyltransferase
MFKYGIYLPLDLTFGNNLRIFHWGGVIINPNAKIGNNVTVMQGVTIGNNMKNSKCPVISDNVFIGAGAKVIGDVFVAKGVRIGANAVVTKSIYQENITVVGIPARNIK